MELAYIQGASKRKYIMLRIPHQEFYFDEKTLQKIITAYQKQSM